MTWDKLERKNTSNLNPNPSVEVDTDGYATFSSTISRDTTEHYHGVASLKCVTNNTGSGEGWQRTVTNESLAGLEYTFSVYLKGSGTVILSFWDDVITSQSGSLITLLGTWTRYSLTKTFDVGSIDRRFYVRTNTQQGITFYSDAIMHRRYPPYWVKESRD